MDISTLYDMALDLENYVITSADHLWEKRHEMYKKGDAEILREVIPALNEIIQDAEKYKAWIMEQFDK